jgi:hypothetical protein
MDCGSFESMAGPEVESRECEEEEEIVEKVYLFN